MIELHRPNGQDARSDEIEERLQKMVAAYKVERHAVNTDWKLPFLKENDRIITSNEEMDALLTQIEQQLKEQRMVSGDACYIDPQTGEIC